LSDLIQEDFPLGHLAMHCVIHIGGMKTGTTSIQRCFHERREDILSRFGFWYPKTFMRPNEPLHRDLSTPGATKSWVEGRKTLRLERRAAIESGAKTAVFSSEFFHVYNAKKVARLLEYLGEFFESFSIVYYARRQDHLLASLHSTEIRSAAGNTDTDPLSAYQRRGHAFFDHLQICDAWAGSFGAENITARIFERQKLVSNDVLTDFASVIGLPLPEKYWTGRFNYSLSLEVLATLIHLNGSAEKDNENLRRAIISGQWAAGDRDIPMILRRKAKKFVLGFEESNAKFFSQYVDPGHAKDFEPDFMRFAMSIPEIPLETIEARIQKARDVVTRRRERQMNNGG
jgi:hypothetical protein